MYLLTSYWTPQKDDKLLSIVASDFNILLSYNDSLQNTLRLYHLIIGFFFSPILSHPLRSLGNTVSPKCLFHSTHHLNDKITKNPKSNEANSDN